MLLLLLVANDSYLGMSRDEPRSGRTNCGHQIENERTTEKIVKKKVIKGSKNNRQLGLRDLAGSKAYNESS